MKNTKRKLLLGLVMCSLFAMNLSPQAVKAEEKTELPKTIISEIGDTEVWPNVEKEKDFQDMTLEELVFAESIRKKKLEDLNNELNILAEEEKTLEEEETEGIDHEWYDKMEKLMSEIEKVQQEIIELRELIEMHMQHQVPKPWPEVEVKPERPQVWPEVEANPTIESLELTELKAKLLESKAINLELYTKESASILLGSIQKAEVLLQKVNNQKESKNTRNAFANEITQMDINNMVIELDNSIKQLVKKEVVTETIKPGQNNNNDQKKVESNETSVTPIPNTAVEGTLLSYSLIVVASGIVLKMLLTYNKKYSRNI